MDSKISKNIAICGNPNSGKTTIFNYLTGGKQQTGNWPGVTVERKEGKFTHRNISCNIIDLPGTYSLAYNSIDERIAVDYLIKSKPDVVFIVTDSSNLERNFYLVVQLMELGISPVIDLNMMDLAYRNNIKIDIPRLSKILGLRIVSSIGNRRQGIEDIKDAIIDEILDKNEVNFRIHYPPEIEKAIDVISKEIEDSGGEYPSRWISLQLLEDNPEIKEKYSNHKLDKLIDSFRFEIEKRYNHSITSITAERRYSFIYGLIREVTTQELALEDRFSISDKIDKIVANRWLGLPIFFLALFLMFSLVFGVGTPIADYLDNLFFTISTSIQNILYSINAPEFLISLLTEGIIPGVGSVLVFVPNITLLFFCIAFLEDSGYMARVAVIMDKIMHSMGLHGKSFIPLIIGLGCNVPGIMATRTLETEKDRIITILVNPLVSCSARLPIYLLFTGIFFRDNRALIIISIYLIGLLLAVLIARLFRWLFFKQEDIPLIMELPPYQLPTLRSLFFHSIRRTKLFVRKAGTVIFLGVIVIWALSYLPLSAEYASSESIIGRLGKFIAPLFKPAGFGFWQPVVALLFGIVAKEIVVGTLGTLYGVSSLSENLMNHFTPLSAYSFMIMALIYIPCIPTIAVIKQEAGWKWAALSVGYSLLLGWLLAVIIFQVGSIF